MVRIGAARRGVERKGMERLAQLEIASKAGL
jgi:hypothetical protein